MSAPEEAEKDLHEFVDAEIEVTDLEDPAKEKALAVALEKITGVQSVRILPKRVAITYDPVSVTKADLVEAIRREGVQVGQVETGLSSPVADACETPQKSSSGLTAAARA